jgi:TolB-like protein
LERWLDGRPIVARPVSPPARIWRWSQRNPKLVGAATAGLLLGAAAVWLFRGELFRPSQFNPPDRSIAVLPFTDSSEAKDQGRLCDGISEEILDTLAQVDGLRVAGRTSSFSLKGKNTQEVGKKLNVGNVLEGSLQRQGDRVRVIAELIDARNGFRVWSETYDRKLDDAFAIQDEIARSVSDALKVKLAVRLSDHNQPGKAVNSSYLQQVLTDVTPLTQTSSNGISVSAQNPSNPSTVPDYTSPESFGPPRPDTQVTAASLGVGVTETVHARVAESNLRTNKITADVIAAPPDTAFNSSAGDRVLGASLRTKKITAAVTAEPPGTEVAASVRDRASEAALRTNKTTPDVTATPGTEVTTSMRGRASEAGLRTNKIAADGPASIQGFVKDAKGEPITGTDVRIESRDGKKVFSIVKTDSKGRYSSQGLQPGVYRVTLLVNGAVKSSIMNTQTKANQPTQLNFELKPPSQAGNTAKGGKHMVWVPSRTGSHIGGTWIEVDAEGNPHFDSNIQTYNVRR